MSGADLVRIGAMVKQALLESNWKPSFFGNAPRYGSSQHGVADRANTILRSGKAKNAVTVALNGSNRIGTDPRLGPARWIALPAVRVLQRGRPSFMREVNLRSGISFSAT